MTNENEPFITGQGILMTAIIIILYFISAGINSIAETFKNQRYFSAPFEFQGNEEKFLIIKASGEIISCAKTEEYPLKDDPYVSETHPYKYYKEIKYSCTPRGNFNFKEKIKNKPMV